MRAVGGFCALGMMHLFYEPTLTTAWLARCVIITVAVLLWIGLWTPIAAVATVLLQIGVVSSGLELSWASLVNAALCLALAMLGPGSWSLDARLFGRKRIL